MFLDVLVSARHPALVDQWKRQRIEAELQAIKAKNAAFQATIDTLRAQLGTSNASLGDSASEVRGLKTALEKSDAQCQCGLWSNNGILH